MLYGTHIVAVVNRIEMGTYIEDEEMWHTYILLMKFSIVDPCKTNLTEEVLSIQFKLFKNRIFKNGDSIEKNFLIRMKLPVFS